MAFSIKFSEEKNELLKATRNVSFEDVLETLKKKKLLADIAHPNQKRLHQRIYVVKLRGYAYSVPYVINNKKQEIFLKTIYPSRALTKLYLEGGKNEKKK
jgi:hypothetical protein